MVIPSEPPTRLRTDSVEYRKREAQTAPTTPIVSLPESIPALATLRARRAGSAARTCSTTRERSSDRVLSALILFPVRDNKSLRLLGFCIAAREMGVELRGKTVRKSLF